MKEVFLPVRAVAHPNNLDGLFLLLIVTDICSLLWLLTSCHSDAFYNSYWGKLVWLLSVFYIRAANTERSSKSHFQESKDQLMVRQVAPRLCQNVSSSHPTRFSLQSLLGLESLLNLKTNFLNLRTKESNCCFLGSEEVPGLVQHLLVLVCHRCSYGVWLWNACSQFILLLLEIYREKKPVVSAHWGAVGIVLWAVFLELETFVFPRLPVCAALRSGVPVLWPRVHSDQWAS